jgi:tetratricopeptide (TPR) repeat protein
VDKSLLQWNPSGRYEIHELVRHYAEEKLQAAGEVAEIQARHFDYFLDLAQTILPRLEGVELPRWLDQLEVEMDNLRAALTWSLLHGDVESSLKLTSTLWWFWYTRSYFTEGREWLDRALAREDNAGPSEARAKALQGAGVLAWNQGDYVQARQYHEASLAIMRSLGNQRAISVQLNNLGTVALDQGDYDRAATLLEESLAIKKELGDESGTASTLNNLGLVAFGQGDYAEACAYYEQSLAMKRALGDTRGIAITVGNLGNAFFELGHFEEAHKLLQESVTLKRELGDRWGVAVVLRHLGELAIRWGDLSAAHQQLYESLAIRQQLDDKWSIADSLEAFATLAFAEHEPDRAAQLWGAAENLRETIGASLPTPDRVRHDRDVTAARKQVDDSAWQSAWAKGRTLSVDEAVAYALSGTRNE